ncbi:cell cycle control histidine kinase CckA [Neorhizobium sp. R1-B]|uniref:cell cycle histidine kinase CckA n=1 Tax=unclassified Neorhizobium TaxID=2629175 RepID=UPI00104FCFA3|nr:MULTISPECIES: PAS domain-containing sensor histidine kinase [unclassified Neorhizobium]TCV64391.1 cell cycle control histidine kinase CckA [Neorhizobium sp. S3-V5DH]TDX74113.1 cell cycle control histidine kinase CckA [Neorhizobium sp. R1-B]
MTKLQQGGNYEAPLVERSARGGTIVRIVLLALVLCGVAAGFVLFQHALDNEVVLGLLGILAMVGIFFLVSSLIGLVELMPQSRSDELARGFLASHPDGILITDPKGRVLYANAAYGRMTGATKASNVQSLEALLSRTRESTEALYRLTTALREGREGHEEFRLLQPLGRATGNGSGAHWYRLKARLLGASGKSQLDIWQITDITSEREDQERFFRELQNAIDYLDHAPAGFFSAGRKGEIFYLNATLAEWLGIDLTKFTPRSMTIADMVAGEGMALIQSVQAAPGLKRTETLDLDLRRTNGQSLPVRLVHNVSATRDGAPGESRTIVLARPKGGEGDQSASAMRFTRFFNNTPMAIASVDGAGKILRINAPFLKLFAGVVSRDEIDSGVELERIVHENTRQQLMQALAAAKDRQGDIPPIDSRHPGDENRYVRFYVNAVIDESDEAPEEAAIVYAVETTEQKALETQMAQTQKLNAVGTLAGGIAHDFNNVLTAILLSSDHLLLQARPSDASFADLMEIKRNANRAAVLVRQLLAFSRKQTMRPAVLNLTDVVGDLRMLVDRLISGTNVKLEVDYGRDLWPVRTDLSQFEQVLINLCVNARDAMPTGGTILIKTRNVSAEEASDFHQADLPSEDFVMVEVSDTGTGIPPAIMDKIFEPFFTTKEVGKGTGLGLSMVYGIVKQSGGYIYPESEVGRGTSFRIFLPRHIPETPAVIPGAAATAEPAPSVPVPPASAAEDMDLTGKSAVVLLVEDEEAVRRGGKRMLETRGYTVHEAGSGVEALDIMEELEGRVDIVVSDVVMPEMDGPTLLAELRKSYPDLKFIFVSGYAEDAFARNLPADAKFGFLPKPFSLKQLAVAVREMLDSD